MYILIDCQSSTGIWKADKIRQIKDFAELVLLIEDISWIHFRNSDIALSPCERYEAQKVDGRTVKDVEWVWM